MKLTAINSDPTELRQLVSVSPGGTRQMDLRAMGGASLQGASSKREGFYRDHGKRLLDIGLTLLLLAPVSLTVLIIAALVALDGGRPFYVQPRVGRGGRLFPMFKIRTMVRDADAALEQHLAANPADRAEWDDRQKLRHDPRVTRIGHILRRTSLDELPQFFNVLRGDMTLVGPRPFMPSQTEYYHGDEYYDLRPGITGFWQTSVRNEANFAQRAAFDRSYFRALSPRTDLKVIARTILVVLRGTGV